MTGKAAMLLGEGLIKMQGLYDDRRREEAERKRKAPMEELALLLAQQNVKKGGMELAEAERKNTMAEEGRGLLDRVETDIQDAAKLKTASPDSFMGGLGPISPERYDELGEVAKSGPLKYAQESGLYKYAPYEEGVKSTLDMLSGKATQKPGVFGYKENYDTPENRAKNESAIQALVSSGKIDDVDAMIYRNANQGVGVYEVMNKLNQMATGVSTAVRTAEETIPAKTRAAGSTAAASTIGGAQGRHDIPKETGMENFDPATGQPFTAQQRTDAAHAVRLERANKNLDKLKEKYPEFDESTVDNAILSNVDQKGFIKASALNAIKDPALRQFCQAKLDFVMATLRKESGAAINANEYVGQSARYTPQMGDDPETIAQKREARIIEEATAKAAAGEAALQYFKKQRDKLINDRTPKSSSSSFESLWGE